MKSWLKYLLIFGIIGAILGAILGPIIITATLECPIDSVTGQIEPCMGSPLAYMQFGFVIGLILGLILGFIVWKIKSKK